MLILGLSAFYHDSAAALVADGEVLAAAQEERFTRRKHDARFPEHAIRACLAQAGVGLGDVDHVVFFEKPFLKFERLLETYVQFAPRGFASFRRAMPLWIKEKLFQKPDLERRLGAIGALRNPLLFSEHHLSHAASAFYPSPFEEAAVLTLDGVGEWASSTLALGRGTELAIHREIHFPHSLGLLYSAFTSYCGFRVNSGEYKLMGLAPYGEPRFAETIRERLIDLKEDGSFRLDLSCFDYCTGLRMTSRRFHRLFGGPPREPESELTQRHMDLAASIQAVIEDAVLRLGRSVRRETGQRRLCLAGGVALNCVATGRLRREGLFDDIWIQPAAGDAGGSLGAALYAAHAHLGQPRARPRPDGMAGAYLGPAFTAGEIERRLEAAGARFERLDEPALLERCAGDLAAGKALGWFQGRMEFGPRALGNRSILADPRGADTQRTLNLKIKFRESFRPFAPAVLEEKAAEWFGLAGPSPYMTLVDHVRPEHRRAPPADGSAAAGLARLAAPRSTVPAVTHVDHSARIQTVSAQTNPRFHGLIRAFEALTGCPLLVNTSFNVRGEPIVCTPEDAFRCFMGTGLEVLAVGDFYLRKDLQDTDLVEDYASEFRLD